MVNLKVYTPKKYTPIALNVGMQFDKAEVFTRILRTRP
jgi:hypothetical protein